jgi:hypothetical protein
MAQVPATPKLKRRALLLLTRCLGPKATQSILTMQASEHAALDLRATSKPVQAPECVIFIVPLVSARDVNDWEGVQARLSTTLGSFQAQTNLNWQAFIACQDLPRLPDDPRIHHIPFTQKGSGNDKWEKLTSLARHLQGRNLRPGYVMSFDADDLIACDAVETMLSPPAQSGHLVVKGYVKDIQNDDVALAQNTLSSKPFWKLCGSCAAFRYDTYDATFAKALGAILQHEHRMFPYLAKLAGRPLHAFARPMALYLLNHGDNFGARRGRVGFKTRFVQRFKLTDKNDLDDIATRFPPHS